MLPVHYTVLGLTGNHSQFHLGNRNYDDLLPIQASRIQLQGGRSICRSEQDEEGTQNSVTVPTYYDFGTLFRKI